MVLPHTPAHCEPFDPEPFKMSTVICLLCGAGQRDARPDTGDWYTTVVQSTTGWRWTAWLGGRGDEEGWKTEEKARERSRWQKRGLAQKWQVKWYARAEGEERKRERERGKTTADRQRGAGCERGGGVHAKFELIRQQNSSPLWDFVPYPLLMCVCNYVCPWGGRRRLCLWRESQRWLMVYRRTLMGDSSPPVAAVSVATWVTCNLSPGSEATSPHLRGMRRIHSLCFHPPCVSLNCEVVLRRSKTGCLSAGQRFAGRPSLTSITFTTRSDAKREDVPGCISLSTHMSGYLN